jgi:Zn-dependent metalloprotease
MMRAIAVVAAVVGCVFVPAMAWAELSEVDPADLGKVYSSLRGGTAATERMRTLQTDEGYMRFLGAPNGTVFESGAAAKSTGDPAEVAEAFLDQCGEAFGVLSPNTSFTELGHKTEGGRGYVRMVQTYSGVPVFGTAVIVQTDGADGVLSVTSDIVRDTQALDSGQVSLTPTLTAQQASDAVVALLSAERPGVRFLTSTPSLAIYAPSVTGQEGAVALVWNMKSIGHIGPDTNERILLNAHSGVVAARFSLTAEALERAIYDAGDTLYPLMPSDQDLFPGYFQPAPDMLVRSEGEDPVGIVDADRLYDYIGDTYHFYLEQHGRDSLDGMGLPINGVVHLSIQNAMWVDSLRTIFFERDWVADDVVGHELTHGVTTYTSNLLYFSEPGAINEFFSDLWGEFADLTNGKGNDTDAVRWLMGEDMAIGAIRNMKHPLKFGDPETYRGPGWNFGSSDYAGVHTNCGVGNKMAYLLTDGDSFNGFMVRGMGIEKVAALFYYVQNTLFTGGGLPDGFVSTFDYYDLGQNLIQAAIDLAATDPRFSTDDIDNVKLATYAVEIVPIDHEPLRNFRAIPITGTGDVALTWENPITAFEEVTLVRRFDRYPLYATDGDVLYVGDEESFVDLGAPLGQQAYYGLFVTFPDAPVEFQNAQFLYQIVVVGEEIVFPLYETFDWSAMRTVPDLSFKQLLYSPVGEPDAGRYVLTVTNNVGELPHDPSGAMYYPLVEDEVYPFNLPHPVPFFGTYHESILVSENGYVAFVGDVGRFDQDLNYPLGSALEAIPRISVAFANLSMSAGGSVWAKNLDDRVVLTYDHVPTYGIQYYTNTAQLEIFYSGHIRITYGNISATSVAFGLSDGKGPAYDPEELAATGDLVPKVTDLSSVAAPLRVTIEPVPVYLTAKEGDLIEFDIVASAPGGVAAITAEGLPEPETFIVTGPKEAIFSWQTDEDDAGSYTLSFIASMGGSATTLEVHIGVSDTPELPLATNLEITPATPVGGDMLTASWEFAAPEGFDFEDSRLEWYRNGALVQVFNNALVVPGSSVRVGDFWYFRLTPTAYYQGIEGRQFLFGEVVQSPTVHVVAEVGPGGPLKDSACDVNKDEQITVVDFQLVVNAALGKSITYETDVNADGATNALDVQCVVIAALAP